MPFGLTNAPGTFQRAMNNMFREVLYKCVVVYLDDIIVYSKTLEEHIGNLEHIFSLLDEKSKKIASITTYPQPTNQKELGSFLGLASYYRKFIRAFAEKRV